jgi:hypothetical protein
VLQELIGEKADFVNARMERDMILPSQKAGLRNWINSQKDVEPKYRREIEREIAELNTALDGDQLHAFSEKLASLSLGVAVTRHEKEMIYKLTDAANAALRSGDEAEFNEAKAALDAYVASLMPKSEA